MSDLDDEEIEATRKMYNKNDYVSKNRIREKIEEFKKQITKGNIEEEHLWCLEAKIDILKELLEE